MSSKNGNIMSTGMVFISPTEAKGMIEKHDTLENPKPPQRPPFLPRMMAYANAIRKDDWEETHQGILVSKRGAIMDGMTRLHAIVHANKGIRIMMTIVKEELPELMDSVDVGRQRSAGVVLRMSHGVEHSRTVAASIRTQLFLFQAKITNQLPPAAIYDIYQMQSKTMDRVISLMDKPEIAPSYLVAPFAFYATAKEKKALDFIDAYINLENLGRGHPALTLHKTVQSHKKAHHKIKLLAMLTIHALSKWDEGATIVELMPHEWGADWLGGTNPTLVKRMLERCL